MMLIITVTHPSHSKYHEVAMFHEAGYDSLLTATILLRLSAKMNADRQQPDDASDSSFKTAVEQPNGPTDQLQSPQAEVLVVKKKAKKGKKAKSKCRIQTRNAFEQLSIDDQGTSSLSDDDHGGGGVAVGELNTTPSWQDEVYVPDTSGWVPIEKKQREPMEMIPAWSSEFWQSFGNTLRVYGTEETVLKIAKW
jgi:poly(A)-specific ribonuclease